VEEFYPAGESLTEGKALDMLRGKQRAAAAAAAIMWALSGSGLAWAQSDASVRQAIINASNANYSGSCPCPYSTDHAGRRCGGRSAYSRPGGEAPKCFAADVTAAEIKAYRGGQ
jgi:hypothetical protein